MHIISNTIRLENLYDLPKSHRKDLRYAMEKALHNGDADYRSGKMFKVGNTGKPLPKQVMISGSGKERMLKVNEFAELAAGGRWWRFYLGIDYDSEPREPFLSPDYLKDAMLDPAFKKEPPVVQVVTPRIIYATSSATPGYHQWACYRMNDVDAVSSVFSKPRYVIVQTEHGHEVVAALLGKDKFLSMGSALMAKDGGLLEI